MKPLFQEFPAVVKINLFRMTRTPSNNEGGGEGGSCVPFKSGGGAVRWRGQTNPRPRPSHHTCINDNGSLMEELRWAASVQRFGLLLEFDTAANNYGSVPHVSSTCEQIGLERRGDIRHGFIVAAHLAGADH